LIALCRIATVEYCALKLRDDAARKVTPLPATIATGPVPIAQIIIMVPTSKGTDAFGGTMNCKAVVAFISTTVPRSVKAAVQLPVWTVLANPAKLPVNWFNAGTTLVLNTASTAVGVDIVIPWLQKKYLSPIAREIDSQYP